jgi:uncharacterized protein
VRRNEFNVENQEEIRAFLHEMSFGYLASSGEDGWPHLTPLNYVYLNGHIYFHGSHKGEKMRDIAACGRVAFAVAKEYAIIPSYYSDPHMACPASAFFKSVHIRGTAGRVTDLSEKAAVLSALMGKLQPEGGFDPITPDDPRYVRELKAVAVVRLSIEEMTAKFKFGQNMDEGRRETVISKLQERNRPDDGETAELMRKYCPVHRQDGAGE